MSISQKFFKNRAKPKISNLILKNILIFCVPIFLFSTPVLAYNLQNNVNGLHVEIAHDVDYASLFTFVNSNPQTPGSPNGFFSSGVLIDSAGYNPALASITYDSTNFYFYYDSDLIITTSLGSLAGQDFACTPIFSTTTDHTWDFIDCPVGEAPTPTPTPTNAPTPTPTDTPTPTPTAGPTPTVGPTPTTGPTPTGGFNFPTVPPENINEYSSYSFLRDPIVYPTYDYNINYWAIDQGWKSSSSFTSLFGYKGFQFNDEDWYGAGISHSITLDSAPATVSVSVNLPRLSEHRCKYSGYMDKYSGVEVVFSPPATADLVKCGIIMGINGEVIVYSDGEYIDSGTEAISTLNQFDCEFNGTELNYYMAGIKIYSGIAEINFTDEIAQGVDEVGIGIKNACPNEGHPTDDDWTYLQTVVFNSREVFYDATSMYSDGVCTLPTPFSFYNLNIGKWLGYYWCKLSTILSEFPSHLMSGWTTTISQIADLPTSIWSGFTNLMTTLFVPGEIDTGIISDVNTAFGLIIRSKAPFAYIYPFLDMDYTTYTKVNDYPIGHFEVRKINGTTLQYPVFTDSTKTHLDSVLAQLRPLMETALMFYAFYFIISFTIETIRSLKQ